MKYIGNIKKRYRKSFDLEYTNSGFCLKIRMIILAPRMIAVEVAAKTRIPENYFFFRWPPRMMPG